MKPSLCISFRFIHPYPLFHGRGDADEPEWPPSPMRAFQSLLNAACLRNRGRPLSPEVQSALQVLERVCPSIVAPRATLCSIGYRAYVPHNQADLVTAAWDRGNNEASIASHRIEKDYRPHRIEAVGDELPTLHYLYPLDSTDANPDELLAAILPSVRSVHCLGWGIDQVVSDALLVDPASAPISGEKWKPTPRGGRRLRVHRIGSLEALTARHGKFLDRLIQGDWTPVPPLIVVDQVHYRRDLDPIGPPHRVFDLRNVDGSRCRYPHRLLVHIAGMVRHLAIEAMEKDPPRGIGEDWVETYVAGHRKGVKVESVAENKCRDDVDEDWQREASEGSGKHRQLSYLPLPSIGHEHTDPGVRRVMIVAPVGDDAWLDHVARRLAGKILKPVRGDEVGDREPPMLVPVRNDNIARIYTQEASVWHSFTPVILPGHDDHRPEKTRQLIEKALRQSGVEHPCDFEWSPFSHFRKSLSAHKYDRDGRPQGYIRPGYLLTQTAVHLTLRFHDGSGEKNPIRVPGPLSIGSGRHCGLGLFVPADLK